MYAAVPEIAGRSGREPAVVFDRKITGDARGNPPDNAQANPPGNQPANPVSNSPSNLASNPARDFARSSAP